MTFATRERERVSGRLKKAYYKSFFTIIKAYKRYYLGVQFFKIPFYKLISNSTKLHKWQEKCKQRLEFLQNSLKNFKDTKRLYKEFDKQSKIWLNSKEFKEKYLDTKHPYPPLLDPKMLNDKNSALNYSNIPAEMAWEWNLPLPNNYKFIFLSTHGVGRAATESYLKLCGVYYDDTVQLLNNEQKYIRFYNELIDPFYPTMMVYITEVHPQDQEKFISLLEKKPFLMLIRDPILNLKTLCNYPAPNPEDKKDFFTLSDKDFVYFSRYVTHKHLENQRLDDINHILRTFIAKSGIFNLIKGEAIILQTDDVKPSRAFETFQKLAKALNFDAPKESDRRIFEANLVQGMLSAYIPIILKIYDSDFSIDTKIEPFDIQISTNIQFNLPFLEERDGKEFCDIIDFLGFKDNVLSADLVIMIEMQHFEILKKDAVLVEKIKNYLKELITSLAEQNEAYKKLSFTERDILNFLANSPTCRKALKEHLEDRVVWFKENRPDIVESWKCYGEFEEMCAKLDKE